MSTDQETDSSESDTSTSENKVFSSKWALIFSCLGCVVGTGNIWRFPRIVAKNSGEQGSLQFLIAWLLFLFLWSIPIVLIEYAVGRFTKKSTVRSFRVLLGPLSSWCGAWMTVVNSIISCYYSVVLGWCFYYLYYSITHELPSQVTDSKANWNELQDTQGLSVLLHFLSLLVAGLTIVKGVTSIELVNTLIVPLLLIILVFSFYWSLTLKFADRGIKFLFSPDWDKFGELPLWVDAATQNAWDTGAGVGMFLTYATFMTRQNSVVKIGTLLPACNNLISLLCVMTTFNTVFHYELDGNAAGGNMTKIMHLLQENGNGNTGLTFIWMPVLFSKIPTIGRVLCSLFFLCLSLAGVSSLVACLELPVHNLEDVKEDSGSKISIPAVPKEGFSATSSNFFRYDTAMFHFLFCLFGYVLVPRKYSLPIVMIIIFCGGLPSALDMNILVNQDFVWGFALIIAGMMTISLPIRYGVTTFRQNLVNAFGVDDWKLPKLWEYIVKFLVPIEAVTLLAWFAFDNINSDANWYKLGEETFMMCIVQWLVVMFCLIMINVAWRFWRKRRQGFYRVQPIYGAIEQPTG